MNGESYAFALLTAVVGMGVVFSFLVFLSLVMVGLRRVFEPREQAGLQAGAKSNSSAATAGRSRSAATAGSAGGGVEDPAATAGWIAAAVGAYLLAEARDAAPSAAVWTPETAGRTDPWALAATRSVRAPQGAYHEA